MTYVVINRYIGKWEAFTALWSSSQRVSLKQNKRVGILMATTDELTVR